MPKPQPIRIEIPHPCHKSWDEMTPSGSGRHCAHCNKTVTDFTEWTDRELYSFFTKHPEGSCGRFLSTQVDRDIIIPYQPHSRLYRIVAGLELALIFTQAANAQTNVRPPLYQQQQYANDAKKTGGATGTIKGRVLDDKKEPLISAAVEVFQNNIMMGGSVTDYDGNYTISPLYEGSYDLVILYAGLDTFIVKDVLTKDTTITTVNAVMTRKNQLLQYNYTMGYRKPLVDLDTPASPVPPAGNDNPDKKSSYPKNK